MILLWDSEIPDQTADVYADQGLGCPQMPEDRFLHCAALNPSHAE